MNAIDKRKMVQGVLYNFHLEMRADMKTVDFCEAVKNLAREHGFLIRANKYSQLEIVDRDSHVRRAVTFII